MPNINKIPDQIQKTQYIRLMDVGIFGPLMIYTALGKTPPRIVKNSMVLIGIGTILYNGYNFWQQKKRENNEQN